MLPLPPQLNPNWYEDYWYGERPRRKRRVLRRSWTRFGVLFALLAGGSLLLGQFYP